MILMMMQLLDLETVSASGAVTWIADTKQFIHCPFFGHTTGTWGYIEYYVFDWTGMEYEQTLSLLRESGRYIDENDNEYGRCYINDEETDAATFEEKLEENPCSNKPEWLKNVCYFFETPLKDSESAVVEAIKDFFNSKDVGWHGCHEVDELIFNFEEKRLF